MNLIIKKRSRLLRAVLSRRGWKNYGAWLFATSFSLLLTGCGGGGPGGDDQGADPGTVEYPIAYVRRPVPAANAQPSDLSDPFRFNAGAHLFVRSRADGNAPEVNVTDQLFSAAQSELYDVRDLAVSPDGKKLLFALHPPLIPNADPADQTTWDIWEYEFSTRSLRRIITSDNREQQGNDVSPNYLDDGRIVFVSDRQEGMREYLASTGVPAYSALVERAARGNGMRRRAGVLHVMDTTGNNLTQISFNQSHDLWPSLLQSGKLVFTRLDDMGGQNLMNLYTMNPSGMGLSLLYGRNSHDTGTNPTADVQFSQPRQMEDGRLVAILRPTISRTLGGDIIAIDAERYSDHDQPTWENTGLGGSGQVSLAVNPVNTDDDDTTVSPGGDFSAAYPLFDGTNRLLVSWSQCRQMDNGNAVPCSIAPANAPAAPPLYGIWIYDAEAGTQKPIVTPQEGVIFTDIVAAAPRRTFGLPSEPVDTNPPGDDLAVIDIRSVYNLDGTVRNNAGMPATPQFILDQVDPANPAYLQRRARFIQVVQGVPIPNPDDEILEVPNFAFGINRSQLMRHIVGYAPIEPDGSVKVRVPVNVPISFNILDANAQRISPRHNVWWQLREGEVLRCAGCHDGTTQFPHGRLNSAPPEVNPGATTLMGSSTWIFPISQTLALSGTESGQTLAQIFAVNQPQDQPRLLSVNVEFTDEWATMPAQQAPDLDYRYSNPVRQVPVLPLSAASCETQPGPSCRIIINYQEHIQPIWDKSRPQLDNMGNPVLDGMGNPIDNRCTRCHTIGWVDNGATQPPAGQLELTSGPSDRSNDFVMSYSELFTGDNQVDQNGADLLQDDGNGNLITVPVGNVMSAAGARSSPRFFGCFRTGGTCGVFQGGAANDRHIGWLTPAEQRLLSEWLDIGAQYYNDVVKAAQAGP